MTFAEHASNGLRQRIGSDLLSDTGLSLLQGFLTYNPARRLTADAALEHAYFKVGNAYIYGKFIIISYNDLFCYCYIENLVFIVESQV